MIRKHPSNRMEWSVSANTSEARSKRACASVLTSSCRLHLFGIAHLCVCSPRAEGSPSSQSPSPFVEREISRFRRRQFRRWWQCRCRCCCLRPEAPALPCDHEDSQPQQRSNRSTIGVQTHGAYQTGIAGKCSELATPVAAWSRHTQQKQQGTLSANIEAAAHLFSLHFVSTVLRRQGVRAAGVQQRLPFSASQGQEAARRGQQQRDFLRRQCNKQ